MQILIPHVYLREVAKYHLMAGICEKFVKKKLEPLNVGYMREIKKKKK